MLHGLLLKRQPPLKNIHIDFSSARRNSEIFIPRRGRMSTGDISTLFSSFMCVYVDNARDLLVNLCLCNSIESENNEGSALSVIVTTNVLSLSS